MSRLLITGSEGYIGTRLRAYLESLGLETAALDAGFFASDFLYGDRCPPFIRQDTREIGPECLAGFDAVLHLADLSNDPLGELDPELTRDINYAGTVRLAHAAREAGVARFIYYSSCSVYGEGGDTPCTEERDPKPLTEYARCKTLCESALRELASEGFSPVFLRNATVYGPSPKMRFDLVVNNLTGLAHNRGRIELTSDGTPRRPLIHVEDLCRATELAVSAPREAVHSQTFNTGADRDNFSILAIAEAVREEYPECEIRLGSLGADRRSYAVAFGKIREMLGFEPMRTLEDGVAELRALFERVGLTRERFEDPSFTRLKRIRILLETGKVNRQLFWAGAS